MFGGLRPNVEGQSSKFCFLNSKLCLLSSDIGDKRFKFRLLRSKLRVLNSKFWVLKLKREDGGIIANSFARITLVLQVEPYPLKEATIEESLVIQVVCFETGAIALSGIAQNSSGCPFNIN